MARRTGFDRTFIIKLKYGTFITAHDKAVHYSVADNESRTLIQFIKIFCEVRYCNVYQLGSFQATY